MSQTSEAMSEIDVQSPVSPVDADLRLFRSDSRWDKLIDIKEYVMGLPNQWKDDLIALINLQPPSPAIAILLLIPSAILIATILIIILISRIVLGVRMETSVSNASTAFIVFGDYGRNGLFGQQMVAVQLEKFCSTQKCDFIVTTGDNIYNYGVQSPDDKLFKTSFEDVYLKGSIKDLKYYHVLGNHDWAGKPSAEIAYAKRPDTAWEMPDFYYDKTFSDDLHMVFLDTTPFNSNVYPFSNREEMEPRRTEEAIAKQLNFLSESLEKSTAKWKFVVGHHPCYSTAQHGDSPDIIRVLESIFKEHQISAYIAGHDHNQQHLQRSNIDHFISGAASQMRSIIPNHWNLKWADDTNGFLHILISDESVIVRAVQAETLKVIYEYTIKENN